MQGHWQLSADTILRRLIFDHLDNELELLQFFMPGGYSALRRLYSEVQEPMISAAQETFQPGAGNAPEANPFAGLFPPTSQAQQAPRVPTVPAGTENTNPLPNPWAPPTSGAPPTSTTTNSAPGPTPGGLYQLFKYI